MLDQWTDISQPVLLQSSYPSPTSSKSSVVRPSLSRGRMFNPDRVCPHYRLHSNNSVSCALPYAVLRYRADYRRLRRVSTLVAAAWHFSVSFRAWRPLTCDVIVAVLTPSRACIPAKCNRACLLFCAPFG